MCVLGFWSSTNHNSFHLEWDVCNCSWRIPVFSIDTSSIQTKFKIDILKKLFYKILLAYGTMNYPQREVYFLVNPIYLEFGLNWIYIHRMKNLTSPPSCIFSTYSRCNFPHRKRPSSRSISLHMVTRGMNCRD